MGRILRHFKQTDRLTEAPRGRVLARRRRRQRRCAVRKPPGYRAQRPGDLVQLDTLDMQIVPGVRHKHFTTSPRATWSRAGTCWHIHARVTAATASSFRDHLEAQTPLSHRS